METKQLNMFTQYVIYTKRWQPSIFVNLEKKRIDEGL